MAVGLSFLLKCLGLNVCDGDEFKVKCAGILKR